MCFYYSQSYNFCMQEIDRITQLLKKYIERKGKVSDDKEIRTLIQQYPFIKDLLNEFETEDGLKEALHKYEQLSGDASIETEERMWNRIVKEVESAPQPKLQKQIPLWKYISAACILFIAFVSVWVMQTKPTQSLEQFREVAATFSPGSNRAVLQLSDGQVIELSSEHQGVIVGENLSYEDGSVLIGGFEDQQADLVLTTPKGGQYQLTLADGTKVWMNAGSKLIYPNIFAGKVREVELEGEAYFEVAENKGKPFVVKTASERVEVLGTRFNVSAYKKEALSSVTLLEGSVKVVLPNDFEKIIHPGQQTVTQRNKMEVQKINPEEVIAWKNGEFMFNNENLESVMRKLARWYDLEIEVSPALSEVSIWGSVSRYDDFSKVLEIIQMTDQNIRFKVEGRRVKLMK